MNMFESFLDPRIAAKAHREKALVEVINDRDHYLQLLEDIDATIKLYEPKDRKGKIEAILEEALYV